MPKVDSASANDRTIQLYDGRTLGYAEYGRAEGKALFYFHGHPGARLEARFLADQAAQAGVRLIGIDRPGMGLSSFKADRRIVSRAGDDVAVARDRSQPGSSGGDGRKATRRVAAARSAVGLDERLLSVPLVPQQP